MECTDISYKISNASILSPMNPYAKPRLIWIVLEMHKRCRLCLFKFSSESRHTNLYVHLHKSCTIRFRSDIAKTYRKQILSFQHFPRLCQFRVCSESRHTNLYVYLHKSCFRSDIANKYSYQHFFSHNLLKYKNQNTTHTVFIVHHLPQ